MQTIAQVAETLRLARERRSITQAALRDAAGVSRRTLTKVLGGKDDLRLSTLLAVADRLGLELLLVPKGAATAVTAGDTVPLAVRTRVATVLDQIEGGGPDDER
ncbi:MAG: helix-turn-helix domain-containing protein [Comamonadaceae bacterium]|nr:MAG: helix-turn-helix domain-containing protein [Comamonadaceae bacterium]